MKLRIVSAGGPALIQDGGRPGRMHEGVPPGGALVPELLAAANRALGNPDGAAAIEHYGRLVVECDTRVVAATDAALVELGAEAATLAPRARVGYLAVPGGLDVPPVLGGRGALFAAGIGRLFRGGDELPIVGSAAAPRQPVAPAWSDAPFAVVPGPDSGDVATLFSSTFTISRVGDRTGVRLIGPPVRATPLGSSAPAVRGAIQATPSGELIVLGPDHPTTGGYPIIAVVVARDVGRLFAAMPGIEVRFAAHKLG